MIKINNLTKYYDQVLAVKELSLEINSGEIYGFIGPNGAGKSTTIRCIMNLINKTSGEIFIDGKINDKDDISINKMIGYLPSEIHLYNELTVKQMIDYSASFYEEDFTERCKNLCDKFKLDTTKIVSELSFGNLKKLGIVLAFMHNPKILILDEATNGLDPLMQDEFYDLLLEEKKKGTTIFFSTHNLNEVKKICDRVGIIKEGILIKQCTIKQLTSNSFLIVSIYSKELNKLGINENIIEKETNYIRFAYTKDINELMKKLNNITIDKITIEEPSIEEMFKHFYK